MGLWHWVCRNTSLTAMTCIKHRLLSCSYREDSILWADSRRGIRSDLPLYTIKAVRTFHTRGVSMIIQFIYLFDWIKNTTRPSRLSLPTSFILSGAYEIEPYPSQQTLYFFCICSRNHYIFCCPKQVSLACQGLEVSDFVFALPSEVPVICRAFS